MVTVENIIKNFHMEVVLEGKKNLLIKDSDVNRPGLQLAGFYDYFDKNRLQIIGKTEYSYLQSLPKELRKERIKKFFSLKVPCVIITRNLEMDEDFLNEAKLHNTWILRTAVKASKFIGQISNFLEIELAPQIRLHGVLVDVYGIGILITGESGIGKSEAALELIKRGHRLVADDAVDIKEVDGILYGTCPYITKGMLEVRGMGIIDVSAIYGLSSIISKKTIQLVISIENWQSDGDYERLGLNKEFMEILNVNVDKLRLPIRPGRNIAVIIEAAAANFRYSSTFKISAIDTIEKRMNEENTFMNRL